MTTTRMLAHPPAPAEGGTGPQGTDPRDSDPRGSDPRGTGPRRANRGERLSGLTIRLTPGGYVLAIAALVAGGISLPAAAPGRTAAAYLFAAVLLAALLVGSLILHEVGHAFSARRHGVRVDEISVGLFGSTVHGNHELAGPRAQWRVAAAGPAATLALAGVLGGVAAGVAAIGNDRLAVVVFTIAALGNAVLGVLSLLPGAGPDGGRIVRAFTWARTGDPAKAGVMAARTGQVTGVVMATAGAVVIALGFAAGLWLSLIGILAFATSRSQARQLLTAAALTGLRVRDVLPPGTWEDGTSPRGTPPQVGVQAWLTVEAFIASQSAGDDADSADLGTARNLGNAGNQANAGNPDYARNPGDTRTVPGTPGLAGSGASAFPLVDFDGRPAGLLTLGQLAAVTPDRHDTVRLRDIATPLAHVVTTTGDEPAANLLGRLSVWPRIPVAVHTAGHALVLHPDGALAGVLTPADMARATKLGTLRQRGRTSATATTTATATATAPQQ
jgi:Zn-dependent protease